MIRNHLGEADEHTEGCARTGTVCHTHPAATQSKVVVDISKMCCWLDEEDWSAHMP